MSRGFADLPPVRRRRSERLLTSRDVVGARRSAAGGTSVAVLAYRYDVSELTIAAAVRGEPPWHRMTTPPPVPASGDLLDETQLPRQSAVSIWQN
ncbi:hypothetical protein AN218_22870 [Streptomyces nanshensis]|uniref:Uncharacterized protein n=1 Tax=Streptomyces nanshensis TaxID=518642 RepID=A0A1E7KZE0_9ACTN|nr:hypothetical protein AN218_22870 [Streptomyces nanshensis]